MIPNESAHGMELTILMPCLNEAETLATCIAKARGSLERLGVAGEVLIADNGSTDGSVELAEKSGARVVHVAAKGYGSALRGGIAAARGKFVLMGDADDSYDFSSIEPFLTKLRAGHDLVMGCRMPRGGGTIMPGAMPWKHRWIGNPILSFIGRLFFKCPATDFHCGLRGFSKSAYERMDLRTTGMEFASEMVIKATLRGMSIAEVPITLHPDGRSRPPHLRSWRDGWRHLRFMLLFSPRWLFLVPGFALFMGGALLVCALSFGPLRIGSASLDSGTLAVASMALLVGMQLVSLSLFVKVFTISQGLLPQDRLLEKFLRIASLERIIIFGGLVLLGGTGLLVHAFTLWKDAGFGPLSYSENMRRLIPAATLILVGLQTVFSGFMLSALGLTTKNSAQ
jgi:glycosyltransferase involved in cell wall biosynthesis